jgi:hypothetical protein
MLLMACWQCDGSEITSSCSHIETSHHKQDKVNRLDDPTDDMAQRMAICVTHPQSLDRI